MQIKFISAEDTLDLRSRVLRPGQDLAMCRYPEDNLTSTFHLGIFKDSYADESKNIICNGTFIQQAHPKYFKDAKMPYRLRGMATDSKQQKNGLGRALLLHALTVLLEKNCDLLWFNARTSAEIFYKKLGFQEIDEVFDIPLIGPHKVMYKWFTTD